MVFAAYQRMRAKGASWDGPSHNHRFGRNPAYLNHLRKWREAGTFNINTNRTPQVAY